MPEIFLRKLPGGLLAPVTDDDKDIIDGLAQNEGIRATFVKQRNVHFHRKFFALLKLGFEHWEPHVEYKGQKVAKEFTKFRKDITILAGHHQVVVGIRGEVRYEAKSISFGRMEEKDFSKLYYKVVDVLIEHVMTNYTRDDVDRVVNELTNFASDPYEGQKK